MNFYKVLVEDEHSQMTFIIYQPELIDFIHTILANGKTIKIINKEK